MKWIPYIILSVLLFTTHCKEKKIANQVDEKPLSQKISKPELSKEVYYNKVLGLLIGSAIGDAMGAPTEMWSRRDIQLDYGFVNDLDSMVRTPSAEGSWKNNLPAGGTTDDTRWKKLTVEYLLESDLSNLKPGIFAQFIVDIYKSRIDELKNTDGFDPAPFEENLMKMTWLQEFALVARPFANDDLNGYSNALSKFYGGEMACPGMLYSPVFGAVFPENPEMAYSSAYDLGIFDIGYARDMTALVSAMVAAAFDEKATPQYVLNVNRTVDPEGYFKSRLVGRSAYRFYRYAKNIVFETSAMTKDSIDKGINIPKTWQHLDTLEYAKLKKAFDMLDLANEDVAFHPGEIYLITITAMMFCDFDFEKSMAFIVNYGRDNDTVAAIAGAILGAYWGADKLPKKMTEQVLLVNKQELDIDLEALAKQLTEKFFM